MPGKFNAIVRNKIAIHLSQRFNKEMKRKSNGCSSLYQYTCMYSPHTFHSMFNPPHTFHIPYAFDKAKVTELSQAIYLWFCTSIRTAQSPP